MNECASLTYLLDDSATLFAHLNLIAQAYSLAKLSRRVFYLDDSLWAEGGTWADHFAPVPAPPLGCIRPRPSEMKSCPRGSRHLVLSPATAEHFFGPGSGYMEAFGDLASGASDMWRMAPPFTLSRAGFDAVLRPSVENRWLIGMAAYLFGEAEAADEGAHIGVRMEEGLRGVERYGEASQSAWGAEKMLGPELGDQPRM